MRKCRDRSVLSAHQYCGGTIGGNSLKSNTMKPAKHCLTRHAPWLLFAALAAIVAHAQDDDHIYCLQYHRDIGVTEIYYSGVFRGDFGSTLRYENAFYDYLERRGFRPDIAESYCFFDPTLAEAEQALLNDVEDARRIGYTVAMTEWRPEGSAVPADEPFSPQPLRDFHIAVPASPYDVEICVRDHECEDGDRVRVSINGIELMSGEIVNAWMCRNVALGEGRHDIELFAINGTGFKGEDCSHADANTGEIRVTGADSQTQSWRHRGGAGSSAGIEVTVR